MRHRVISYPLFVSIIFVAILLLSGCSQDTENESGRILFRWSRHKANLPYDELVMMDGDGGNPQVLGKFSGAPSWSPSGKWIAVGCPSEDETAREICILDVSTIPSTLSFPYTERRGKTEITSRIALPDRCIEIEQSQRDDWPYYGIISLSWSPDETRLAVICGTSGVQNIYLEQQLQTCVISLKGKTDCWDTDLGTSIIRAVWSPKDDLLVVSNEPGFKAKVYIVNPDGSNPRHIADGWSPEWSPDGEQIAFFRYEVMESTDQPLNGGIAVVDRNGTNMQWLFLPESARSEDIVFIDECGDECRLTWSPDGKYLAFVVSQYQQGTFRLHRLDVNSGEIKLLLDYSLFGRWAMVPDWEP